LVDFPLRFSHHRLSTQIRTPLRCATSAHGAVFSEHFHSG
jgi:hypothetical protein